MAVAKGWVVYLFAIESSAAFESTFIAQAEMLLLWLCIHFMAILIPYSSAWNIVQSEFSLAVFMCVSLKSFSTTTLAPTWLNRARCNISEWQKNLIAGRLVMEAPSLTTKGSVFTGLCIFLNPVSSVQLPYLPQRPCMPLQYTLLKEILSRSNFRGGRKTSKWIHRYQNFNIF